MKIRTIGVATLLLLPIFFSFTSATATYHSSYYQLPQSINDTNGTVTIILKSGQFDQKTGTIRGILGYTFYIENRGTKEIWYNSSAIQRTLFTDQWGSLNISGNIPPQWGRFWSRIPIISFHPIMTMTIRVTVTNTSTNLTLERSSIELFTTFFVGWTGSESITGPS